jgi:hypothetical protein
LLCMLVIKGGSNSLIVKTKVGSSNLIDCISRTPNLQVQQLEYLIRLEATQLQQFLVHC